MGKDVFVDALGEQAEKRIKDYMVLLDQLTEKIGKANANQIGGRTPSGTDSAIKDLNAQLEQQDAIIKKLQLDYQNLANQKRQVVQYTLQESAGYKSASTAGQKNAATSREQSIAQQILRTETDRNYRANTLLAGAYAKASAQLLILKKEAKDAAISFGANSTQAKAAASAANDLSQRIVSADKAVGDFQRNVGNYSNGVTKGIGAAFSGLRQLAYLLPGIGLAGLFDVAFDSIGKFLVRFKAVRDLFDVNSEAADEYKKIVLDVADVHTEAAVKVDALRAVIVNTSISEKKRQEVLRELKKEIPELSGVELSHADAIDKVNAATNAYIEVSIKRAKAELLIKSIVEQEVKRDELINKSIKSQVTWMDRIIERVKYFNGIGGANGMVEAASRIAQDTGERNKNIEALKKQLQLLVQEGVLAEKTKLGEKGPSFDPNQALLDARVRYLKELAELSKKETENQKREREESISILKKAAEDENRQFDDRIQSYGEFVKLKQDAILKDTTDTITSLEQQRLAEQEESKKAEQAELKRAGAFNPSAAINNAKQIAGIRKYYSDEEFARTQKYSQAELETQRKANKEYLDAAEETAKAEVLIRQKQREILKSIDKIYLDDQAVMFKKNADNDKLSVDIQQGAFESYIAIRQRQLQTDRIAALAAAKTSEEVDKVIVTYNSLKEKLNEEAKDDPYKRAADKSTAALKSLAEGIQNSFLSDAGLGSLSQFFDGTFDKIIEGFDKIENKADSFREKAIYTALAVSEVFQEAFNAISKASSENFDLERSNLEKKYATSKLFAEGNADALAELDKEAEERRRFIANREAKANKRLAEFNIAINAAQGIVAAFKDGNVIKGAIFAAIIAGVAAVQIAALESADVPQYWKGTENHPGGLMRINDQKGSKYREIVETPDGKLSSPTNRNVLMKAPKGTKVYTADQSAIMFDNGLNAVLNERGISMGGNTTVVNDYAPLLGKLDQVSAAISSIPQRSFKLNDSGLGQLVRETTGGQERMNTSLRRIPIIYRP